MQTSEHNPAADELLTIRCQLGEPAAFDDLIARWHAPLWSFVHRLVGNDETARDIFQEVWVRVLAVSRDCVTDPAAAWLFGIARRTLMDRLRQEDTQGPRLSTSTWTESPPYRLRRPRTRKICRRSSKSSAQLPIIEREVSTLFYLQELSLNEVAEALRVPVGTIKSRLSRAKRLLRQAMTARGIQP